MRASWQKATAFYTACRHLPLQGYCAALLPYGPSMFRNIRFYQVEGRWPDDEEGLSKALETTGFEPCGPFTERSSGFEPIAPDSSDTLARRVNGADLFRLRSQSRVLPHSVVNEEFELRVEEFRERTGEAPRGRNKRRLKAEVRDELLPRAMLRSDRLWAYYDLGEKLLAIDAAREAAAERLLRRLQAANDALQFRPLQYRRPFKDLLNSVFLESAPQQFAVGRECRMQDAMDKRSAVRWTNFDLTDRSIRDHVANGMHLTHLGIVYDNVLSCVVDENGVFTKVKFLGMDDDGDVPGDTLGRMDAEFVLLTGTLRHMLREIERLLGR
jgi:recombination associated protein RdgC